MNSIEKIAMTIEEAEEWVIEVGQSVNQLRLLLSIGYDREAWRVLGYSNWTECLYALAAKYGFKKRYADYLHAANQTEKLLHPGAVGSIPEKHLRPLSRLDTNERSAAWDRAVDTAPNGKVTGAHVQSVVNEIRGYHNPASMPHVSHNSGENEWYTPPQYIEAARRVMERIDLDPASSDKANEIVRASNYYTKEEDGLIQAWSGRVWMNPPYSGDLIGKFIDKLVWHIQAGDVEEAIVLVNNATETNWFYSLSSIATAIVFPKGRIRFVDLNGNPSGAPLQGQAFIYSGANPHLFLGEFSRYGWGAEL